ncbi:hypothetical protein [Kineosporia babensis]|uniref:Uncharacterized protein n=1 Tax=Kineosporia babensis TaxID=499548 RepID=A0A9X1NG72_9ACTN|nr:hypothetical protein [Kineosporia babensis]MCD5312994.1 hypothetical protein [Kineosporia babensis]
MTDTEDEERWPDWMLRWPGLKLRKTEIIEGTMIFQLGGIGSEELWTDQDLRNAHLVYPDQPVARSHDRFVIYVGPHAEAWALK